jgi:hypothetical protein
VVVSGFELLSRTVQNGNELVEVSATYSADIFTEDGGVPGDFVGQLSMPGTLQFLYVGRVPEVNPLGTFVTELTDFSFTGMLFGNTFEVKRDPGKTSGGTTTIQQATFVPPITYEVSGTLEVFSLFSFNGSPFMEAPPQTTELSPAPVVIPEPGSGPVAGALLACVVGFAWRRRRIR